MGLEKVVLRDLEDESVYDVYWSSGRLYYMNAWDLPTIQQVLRDRYPLVDQNILVADTHSVTSDPHATINS
jgi:hypothetical protein